MVIQMLYNCYTYVRQQKIRESSFTTLSFVIMSNYSSEKILLSRSLYLAFPVMFDDKVYNI